MLNVSCYIFRSVKIDIQHQIDFVKDVVSHCSEILCNIYGQFKGRKVRETDREGARERKRSEEVGLQRTSIMRRPAPSGLQV